MFHLSAVKPFSCRAAALAALAAVTFALCVPVAAAPLQLVPFLTQPVQPLVAAAPSEREDASLRRQRVNQSMADAPSEDERVRFSLRFQIQRVNYSMDEAPATMTIDTASSYVDYVLRNEQPMHDCVGVTD